MCNYNWISPTVIRASSLRLSTIPFQIDGHHSQTSGLVMWRSPHFLLHLVRARETTPTTASPTSRSHSCHPLLRKNSIFWARALSVALTSCVLCLLVCCSIVSIKECIKRCSFECHLSRLGPLSQATSIWYVPHRLWGASVQCKRHFFPANSR